MFVGFPFVWEIPQAPFPLTRACLTRWAERGVFKANLIEPRHPCLLPRTAKRGSGVNTGAASQPLHHYFAHTLPVFHEILVHGKRMGGLSIAIKVQATQLHLWGPHALLPLDADRDKASPSASTVVEGHGPTPLPRGRSRTYPSGTVSFVSSDPYSC